MSNAPTSAANAASNPPVATPAKTASAKTAPTNVLTSVFDMFEHLNWGEISDVVEAGGRNLSQDVTTAEAVASALVNTAVVAGVPIAGTVQALLPLAENLISTAISFFDAAGGASGAAAAWAHAAQNPAPQAATTTPAA